MIRRFLKWLGRETVYMDAVFYEPLEGEKRIGDYLYPELPRYVYRNKLEARLAAVMADHYPNGRVLWKKMDLFTEDGGRRLMRLRVKITDPTMEIGK